MARLPADEDYARALMTLFSAARAHSGETLAERSARREFLARNFGRDGDFDAALDYAEAIGWVTVAWERIRLTRAGEGEM